MERGYFRSYYLEIASLGALLGGFLKVYISIFACWFIEVNAHICLVTCVVRKKCLVTPSAEGGGAQGQPMPASATLYTKSIWPVPLTKNIQL